MSTPNGISFTSPDVHKYLIMDSISHPERPGRWSLGHNAILRFKLTDIFSDYVALKLDVAGFVAPPTVPVQNVHVTVNGLVCTKWEIASAIPRRRIIGIDTSRLPDSGIVSIAF